MFALPGIIALVIFSLVRPFELFKELSGIPLLNVFGGLAALGYALDIRTGLSQPRVSKVVWLATIWFAWVILTAAISAPATVSKAFSTLLPVYLAFFLISSAVQTRRAFGKVIGVVLGCVVWICLVCLHQAFQAKQCVDLPSPETMIPTGIECALNPDCWSYGEHMHCEMVGFFGLHSINQRVKYTGVLNDPNEVAMLVSTAIPFAIVLWKKEPSRLKTIGLTALAIAVVMTVMATGSRGGLVVLATIVAFYSVQIFGLKRILRILPLIAGVAIVVLVLKGDGGGREDAEASSLQRLGCMRTGIELLLRSPLVGIGYGQFTQYHDLTAHNAYILAASELGFGGLVLWASIAYLSVRSALRVRAFTEADSGLGSWGLAMATSLVGVMTGIFFLSFTYHLVLWILFGLTGALNTLQPTELRRACMRMSLLEVALIATGLSMVLFAVHQYAGSRLGV